jgi:hypothetical protein
MRRCLNTKIKIKIKIENVVDLEVDDKNIKINPAAGERMWNGTRWFRIWSNNNQLL